MLNARLSSKELIRELILEGTNSAIVRVPQTLETIRVTVSLCHECAILARDALDIMMPFYRFPLSRARHKVL
jgi:hypothetical protein